MVSMTKYLRSSVADNTVVVNGATFKLTDDVTEKIMALIDGYYNGNIASVTNTQSVANVSTSSVSTTSTPTNVSLNKTPYKATKDFVPQYKVSELVSTDGTKLFCISRKNGWTKSEKALMNGAIKSLKNIKEISVKGEKGTFKAWGYGTEATAKKHLKELPTVFTVAQLNGES